MAHTTIMRKLVNKDNGTHKTDLMCLVLAAFAAAAANAVYRARALT